MAHDLPGFRPGATVLHRAVDGNPPTASDFQAVGELDRVKGREIPAERLASRAYMEGVSTWDTIARMRIINDTYLRKPWIAVLEVTRLEGVDADHNPKSGHHNLYGDKEVMRMAATSWESSAEDA